MVDYIDIHSTIKQKYLPRISFGCFLLRWALNCNKLILLSYFNMCIVYVNVQIYRNELLEVITVPPTNLYAMKYYYGNIISVRHATVVPHQYLRARKFPRIFPAWWTGLLKVCRKRERFVMSNIQKTSCRTRGRICSEQTGYNRLSQC